MRVKRKCGVNQARNKKILLKKLEIVILKMLGGV